LEIIQIQDNKVKFWVECSKGAYIRTLCHDWGERLGTGAHMSFLLRLSAGPLALEQSRTLEDIRERGEALLAPKECLVEHMRQIQVSEAETERLLHGRTIGVREGTIRLDGSAEQAPGGEGGASGGEGPASGGEGDGLLAAAMTRSRRLAAVGKLIAAAEGEILFKPVKVFDGAYV
jgi:tRNA pseudouridine55 synthase